MQSKFLMPLKFFLFLIFPARGEGLGCASVSGHCLFFVRFQSGSNRDRYECHINDCCGYVRTASMSTHNLHICFMAKNMFIPVHPSFTI